jgi:para-aminobenzoate synthetase component 2
VTHEEAGVFRGLPSPFTATRYHSLAVERETVPEELEITSWTESGVIMGLRHRTLPVEGVQFHPESVLTEWGHRMLANWLEQCGDAGAVGRSVGLAPVINREGSRDAGAPSRSGLGDTQLGAVAGGAVGAA